MTTLQNSRHNAIKLKISLILRSRELRSVSIFLRSLFVSVFNRLPFIFALQGPGLEIFVFCGLLILLLSACLYTIFCRRHGHSHHHHHHGCRSEHSVRMQEDHIVALTNASGISEGVGIGRTTATVPPVTMRQNPPPPPYHIAILIPPPPPPPASLDEAPPPSYDKVIR